MLKVLFSPEVDLAANASLLEQLLGLATAQGEEKTLADALRQMSKPVNGQFRPWQFSALAGFLDALHRRNVALDAFHINHGDKSLNFNGLFAAARALAMNEQAPETERIAAVRLLGR